MVSEYSAELSRWSGGMRFCPQQQTLYGRKFATAPPSATKVRRLLRTEKEKGSSPRGRIGHSGPRKVRIFLLNKKDEKQRTSLEKEKDLHGVKGRYFVSDGTQQNASPGTEQRRPSRRRAAAVQPPLSISDRLRRTLAPEHLANAANLQMSLETLEQTVVETLPESITESGNYADLLCQYLDGFERELGNELDIGCWLASHLPI